MGLDWDAIRSRPTARRKINAEECRLASLRWQRVQKMETLKDIGMWTAICALVLVGGYLLGSWWMSPKLTLNWTPTPTGLTWYAGSNDARWTCPLQHRHSYFNGGLACRDQ